MIWWCIAVIVVIAVVSGCISAHYDAIDAAESDDVVL